LTFKQIRHILIFLVLTIGLHLLFKMMGWPGSLSILVFIPLIYVLIHLISAVIKMVKGRWRAALVAFTIAILFALLLNKMYYVYYNILVTVVFLLLASLVTKRAWKDSDEKINVKRITLVSLLIINVLLLFIPDKLILIYLVSRNEVTWRSLTWSDFQGVPDKTSDMSATTSCGLHYKSNGAFNYPPAIIFAAMWPDNSWVKNDSLSESASRELLRHEQGHFDITELYARKANDSIRKKWGETEGGIDAIALYWNEQLGKMHEIYDSATKHGVNKVTQRIWFSAIQNMLDQKQVQNPSLLPVMVQKEEETIIVYQDYVIFLLKDLKVSTDKVNLLIHTLLYDITSGNVDIHNKVADTIELKYNNMYNLSLRSLDSSITLISSLPEKDDSIKIKFLAINLLGDSKKMIQDVVPWILSMLKTGVDNATPEQKNAFVALRKKATDLKEQNEKFVNVVDSFIQKYNIDYDKLDSAGVLQNDSTAN